MCPGGIADAFLYKIQVKSPGILVSMSSVQGVPRRCPVDQIAISFPPRLITGMKIRGCFLAATILISDGKKVLMAGRTYQEV